MNKDSGGHENEGATESKASLGRPRSVKVDEAILRAALELFVERGHAGVGIEQVAERAGVARTTVYRRWPTKELLIAEAIAHQRGSADEQVIRESVSPQDTVSGVINALAETSNSTEYRQMVARLIGSIPEQPELMAVYARTHLTPRRQVALAALKKARSQGLLREDIDLEIVLDLVAGAMMYRLLIDRDSAAEPDIRTYLRNVFRELRLEEPK